MKNLKKMLIGGRWNIGIRCTTDISFKIVETGKKFFCADPMLISNDNKTYLFVEAFRKKDRKGCLSYFELIDNKFIYKGIILDRPYHLSYPFVFKYHNSYFLIPETSEVSTIELYEANRFPDKWELKKVLLKGKKYVDTTVFEKDGDLYFLTFYKDEKYYQELYKLNITDCSVLLVHRNVLETNTGRGAGAYFENNGHVIRPSQNCTRKYGESIIFNEVIFDNEGYRENQIGTLTIRDVKIEGVDNKRIEGIHTYAKKNTLEVIDFFTKRFDPTFNLFNLLRKKRRMKNIREN